MQIYFEPSAEPAAYYRTGDYWLIPARTATGDVEWPRDLDDEGVPRLDTDGNPSPSPLGPRGQHHYFAPLAVHNPGAKPVFDDCRCRFPRLAVCPGYGSGGGIGTELVATFGR